MREKSMHTTLPWNNRTEWKFAPNEYVVDVCVFAYKWMYKIEELSFDQNTKKKSLEFNIWNNKIEFYIWT